jgi:hypothetical protein
MKRLVGMCSLVFILAVAASTLHAATYTGPDPCNACKNSRYCRHCAKEGAKSGV